jgi:hypothetical protein
MMSLLLMWTPLCPPMTSPALQALQAYPSLQHYSPARLWTRPRCQTHTGGCWWPGCLPRAPLLLLRAPPAAAGVAAAGVGRRWGGGGGVVVGGGSTRSASTTSSLSSEALAVGGLGCGGMDSWSVRWECGTWHVDARVGLAESGPCWSLLGWWEVNHTAAADCTQFAASICRHMAMV